MTKIKYYDTGIEALISKDYSHAKANFDVALDNSSFFVPNDFRYKDDLLKVKSKLTIVSNKLNSLRNQIPKTDEDLLKIFKRIDKITTMEPLDKIPIKERLLK